MMELRPVLQAVRRPAVAVAVAAFSTSARLAIVDPNYGINRLTKKPSAALPPRPSFLRSPLIGTQDAAGKPVRRPSDVSTDTLALINEVRRDVALSEDDFKRTHMPPPADMRLTPSVGKTVHVSGHVDVARSFQLLQRIVMTNKLPTTVRLQRFHERPALKRKRLLRERWRARFITGFRAVVSRTKELRDQGW